jgi:xanthine dehydrogenase small subunit
MRLRAAASLPIFPSYTCVMRLRFVINDQPLEVGDVDPQSTLLDWLRASGRTGSKEGCAEGECGACAVGLLERDAQGRPAWQAINSCLVPMPSLHGRRVVTVEGLAEADGTLHPVQRAMIEHAGSQCGYCTPGFVVSLFCEYYRPDRRDFDPESIAGNLCRCTGYRPIAAAGHALFDPASDSAAGASTGLATTARASAASANAARPCAITAPRSPDRHHLALLEAEPPAAALDYESGGQVYIQPTTLPQLWAAMAAHPTALLLAGGTDLMVYANQRGTRFPGFIALPALPELRRCESNEREIVLGAGLPLAQLQQLSAARELSLLQQLLPLFSSRLIRNRATLGGNLGTASPIGDTPPCLLALDVELTLQRASGTRRLPLREFFLGYRQSALQPGELIVSVHVPKPLPALQRFYKVSKRMLDDISSVAGAFALDLSPSGRVERLRVAYGGVAATPLRALAVEQLAQGRAWNRATLALLLAELRDFGSPLSDQRGSAAYRRAMLSTLLEKFFYDSAVAQVGAA